MDTSLFVRRRRLGILCAVVCFILLIALIDGLLARFRQHPHEFHVLPGTEIPVMGPLPAELQKLEELKVKIEPENGIRFSITGTQTGYWLGGTFWRATILIPEQIPESQYVITVTAPLQQIKKPLARFTVFVHKDKKGVQSASLSFFTKYLGINPWLIFSLSLGIATSIGLLLFLLSSRIEKLLLQEGIGEIYRVFTDQERNQTYVLFGLGRENGIAEDDTLEVLDQNGKSVGKAKIKELFDRNGIAVISDCETNPKPGFLIRKA